MRYLIEVPEEKDKRAIEKLHQDGTIEIISSYDKFERITKDLQKIQTAIELLRKDGYSVAILEGYCRSKGISSVQFRSVMKGIDDFFHKMGLV